MSFISLAEPVTDEGGEETGVPGENHWRRASETEGQCRHGKTKSPGVSFTHIFPLAWMEVGMLLPPVCLVKVKPTVYHMTDSQGGKDLLVIRSRTVYHTTVYHMIDSQGGKDFLVIRSRSVYHTVVYHMIDSQGGKIC